MQTKNKSMDDLDYLSHLGFEEIAVSDKELHDLKKKVRRRFFPGSNSGSLIVTSVALGCLLGALVVYLLNPFSEKEMQPEVQRAVVTSESSSNNLQHISLDTLEIVNDNFVKPVVVTRKTKKVAAVSASDSDTLQVAMLEPSPVPPPVDLTEEKIKFIINSPLTYIHDLKVSDYASLYFKKNQFVKFKERPGLSADNAGKNEQAPTSQLKQEADYFLHQELADGLLCFKQKKYDACIVLLNKVNDFNKTDVNCDFYLGMSYYYKKNYAMSLQHFDACVNNLNNSFLQEAMYYKALSLLGQGSKKEARDLLIKIIQEKEFYSEKARVALEGL